MSSGGRSGRWVWRVLVALLVVLPVTAYVGLEIYGRASLNRAVRAAREGGEPLTFEEIQARRRVWPPEQDGGLVFAALRARLAELQKDKEVLEALPILGNVLPPPLGHRWPVGVQATAMASLATMSKEIEGIDRLRGYAGGSLPFAIPKDADAAIKAGESEQGDLRFAAKLKALQAVFRAIQGDTSHAADDVTVMVRLGGLLSDYPALTSSMVKIAVDALAVDTLQQVLAVAPVAPAELCSIEARLAETEAVDPMYWGVLGDRALAFLMAEQTLKTGAGPGLNGWLRRDEACGLNLHNRLVAVAKAARGRPPAADQLGQEAAALPPRYILTRAMFWSIGRAFTLSIMSTAQLRAARVGSAVERYRLETGDFPQQLDQLVPNYLAQIPLDPFDEKPLRYRVTERAAKIYSIGEDGVDGGGDLSEQRVGKPGGDCGFILLRPELRNLPPVPATQPTASGPVTTREKQ